MATIETRIERLEATLGAQARTAPVILYTVGDDGPTAALIGGKVLAARGHDEPAEAFWARTNELAGPVPRGRARVFLPDNGRG